MHGSLSTLRHDFIRASPWQDRTGQHSVTLSVFTALYGSLRASLILCGRPPRSQIWPIYLCSFIKCRHACLLTVYGCFCIYRDRNHMNFISNIFTIHPFIKRNLSPCGLQACKFLKGKVTPCISVSTALDTGTAQQIPSVGWKRKSKES